MSFKQINESYGLSLKRGLKVKVKFCGRVEDVTITSASHQNRVIVKPLFDEKLRLRFHPMDIIL